VITRAVLTFHGVDDRAGALSYPPADFEALLATLAAANVPIVSLDALFATDTTSGVSLTFDDGMRSVFDVALPILRQHAAPAHLFLRTGAVGGVAAEASACPMLNWDQINLLAEGGVAIENHTHSHPDLRVLSDAEIDAECAMADTLIERHVGQQPRYFAYPFGYCNHRIAERVGTRYVAAFTARLGFLSTRAKRSQLPRIDAHYLRGMFARLPLTTPPARAYLMCRKVLRKIRGSE
jgi:peptidoglycan/xylan/chitin deacetylase (PgdA/CDA1 family)